MYKCRHFSVSDKEEREKERERVKERQEGSIDRTSQALKNKKNVKKVDRRELIWKIMHYIARCLSSLL